MYQHLPALVSTTTGGGRGTGTGAATTGGGKGTSGSGSATTGGKGSAGGNSGASEEIVNVRFDL